MALPLQGIFTALVTPFSADGSRVNESALATLVEAQVAAGVDGVVPCGGTGEFWTLSHEERRRVVEVTVEAAAGRVSVLAQTGGSSTAEAIEHSRHAERIGADAVMVAPPYYEPLNFDLARDYYTDVAGAIGIPLCLYNYPAGSGLPFTVDFVVELAKAVPNIEYYKDSGGSALELESMLVEHSDVATTFVGDDLLLHTGLLMGGKGLVMGLPNLAAPAFVKAMAAAKAGDDAGVVNIWQSLRPLIHFALAGEANYVAATKLALGRLGYDVGTVRKPFRGLTEAQGSRLDEILADLGPELLLAKA